MHHRGAVLLRVHQVTVHPLLQVQEALQEVQVEVLEVEDKKSNKVQYFNQPSIRELK